MNREEGSGAVDFGMPTLMELQTLEDCAALCHELGLQFVELNFNLPQYQPERLSIPYCLRIAQQYGVYFTIHLDENLNVCDFNHRIAAAYRDTVYEAIELAAALGCPILNMHLPYGVYFTLPDGKRYLFEEYEDEYLQTLREFRRECGRLIGESELRICVENTDGYTGFQLGALAVLLEERAFGLTFDVGHHHCAGRVDEAVMNQYGDRLLHMHLHDAARCRNHLALGEGELNLPQMLAVAKEKKLRVVLETKTEAGLRQSVQWLRRNQ